MFKTKLNHKVKGRDLPKSVFTMTVREILNKLDVDEIDSCFCDVVTAFYFDKVEKGELK